MPDGQDKIVLLLVLLLKHELLLNTQMNI